MIPQVLIAWGIFISTVSFNNRQYPTLNTKTGWKLLIKPSKKAIQKIRDRLREEFDTLQGKNQLAVIQRLNPIIRGQANYHRIAVAKRTFKKLDYFLIHRLLRFVKRQHPTKPKYWWKKRYFGKLRPGSNSAWVFGDRQSGAYLLMYSWFPIERHVLVKGTASPDDPSLKAYWLNRELRKTKSLKPTVRRLAEKQKGICPVCGESLLNEEDFHQHHLLARQQRNTDDSGGKILVHAECHQQLTARQRQSGIFLRSK